MRFNEKVTVATIIHDNCQSLPTTDDHLHDKSTARPMTRRSPAPKIIDPEKRTSVSKLNTLLDTLLEYQNEWMKRERNRQDKWMNERKKREEKERSERIEREEKERSERIKREEKERSEQIKREGRNRIADFELLEETIMKHMSTMLASMLGKQQYPQCSQIDKRQQETESYFWQSFWQSEKNLNQDIDKVESILDLSLDDFNQSVKNNATPSMYQHDNEEYYDNDPDDGVEILQKEIHQYDKDGGNQQPAKQQLTKQSSEEPSEQPREEPRNKEAKQRQTKQQHDNDEEILQKEIRQYEDKDDRNQ